MTETLPPQTSITQTLLMSEHGEVEYTEMSSSRGQPAFIPTYNEADFSDSLYLAPRTGSGFIPLQDPDPELFDRHRQQSAIAKAAEVSDEAFADAEEYPRAPNGSLVEQVPQNLEDGIRQTSTVAVPTTFATEPASEEQQQKLTQRQQQLQQQQQQKRQQERQQRKQLRAQQKAEAGERGEEVEDEDEEESDWDGEEPMGWWPEPEEKVELEWTEE